ncbi:MAG: hypothetical protein PUG48_01055 [Clostridia bacterium]|nr:hypothetical protein [Clostridia bacterium]
MTNRIKTVQNPKLILVACKNSERISGIISDILNFCCYNTCIDNFSENTDFIIKNHSENFTIPKDTIACTVIFDGTLDLSDSVILKFRNKATSYEYCLKKYGEDVRTILTYSSENYDADVTYRNKSTDSDGAAVFDIIGTGILSRVHLKNSVFSIDEVLVCTAALIATGIPIASILGYFNASEEK